MSPRPPNHRRPWLGAETIPPPLSRSPADILSALIARADPGLAIEVRGPGHRGPLARVPCHAPLTIRLSLPASLAEAQALVFERDATGCVTVLSTDLLTRGDPGYRRTVEVPRPDAQADGSGPAGTLGLTVLGTSDLVVVIVRSERLRLDRHPVFRATGTASGATARGAAAAIAAAIPAAGAAALDTLYHHLISRPASEWAIAHTRLDVTEGVATGPRGGTRGAPTNGDPIHTASPQPDPAPSATIRKLLDRLEERAMLETSEPEGLSRRREACNQGGNAMSGQFALDFIIPEPELSLIRGHGDVARRLADVPVPDTYIETDVILHSGEFRERLGIARNPETRLFLDPSLACKPFGRVHVLRMAARVAAQAHGLRYDSQHQFWVLATPGCALDGMRSANYLDHIMGEDHDVRSFPKLDLALIAQSFRSPAVVWEADDRDLFEEYLQHEADRLARRRTGKPLLAFDDFDYLAERSQPNAQLRTFDDPEAAARQGNPAACRETGILPPPPADRGAVQIAVNTPVRAGIRLFQCMELPADFQDAECLLFERDADGAVTLISRFHETGGQVRCHRRFDTPLVEGRGMKLGPGRSELFLLVCKPVGKADDKLDTALCFRRSEKILDEGDVPPLAADEFADLRQRVLARRKDDWRVFRTTIDIA